MNTSSPASLTPDVMLRLLRQHAYLWIAPAIAGLVLAAFYSLVTPRTWSASQGLIVRSEAAGYADQRLGKFTDLSEMKTVQETMLELARSQSVVTAVLKEVGPASSWGSRNWPTRENVASFRKRLTITPPGGAEFGNTEVFYIEVKDRSPGRAERLVAALANQLELRLQELRNERAGSMVKELERSVAIAESALAKEVENLAAFETQIGPNLGELRHLISENGGQSSLSQQSAAIEQELRTLDADRRRNQEMLATFNGAQQHPERLLAMPSSLLTGHPTLLRLKEGLVNAQIQTAQLLGSRSKDHPFVQAALETQRHLREEINRHAPEAVRGIEMELAIAAAREQSLRSKLAEINNQQSGIAEHRAEYAQLLANVENQTTVVDTARSQLADAQAHRAGALGASVLARLDRAEAGLNPLGPGRSTTTLAGGLFGLLGGLGAVFFFHAPKQSLPGAPTQEEAVELAVQQPGPTAYAAAKTVEPTTTGPSIVKNDASVPVLDFQYPVTHDVFVGS